MTTVDVLENRYLLTDRYSAPLKHISDVTDRFHAKISSVYRTLSSPLPLIGGAASVAAMTAFGSSALKAQGDFEQMQATLEALTGSAEKAKEKLAFIQKLAIPSTFTFSQLAQAGVELEAFGLRTERILPLIAKLGGAFRADNEHLMMMVRIFGQLAAGQMPDIQSLSAFGLNRQQMAKQGVQFSPDGQLQSSPAVALKALESIINQKYGGILDRMQSTTNAKLTSLTDSWEQAMRVIGGAVATLVLPAVEKLTSFLGFLTQSGALERLARVWAGLTSSQDISAGVVRVLADVYVILESLPERIAAFFKFTGEAIKMFIGVAVDGLNAFMYGVLRTGHSVVMAFERIGHTIRQAVGNIGSVYVHFMDMIARMGGQSPVHPPGSFGDRMLRWSTERAPEDKGFSFTPIMNPLEQRMTPWRDLIEGVLGVNEKRRDELLAAFAKYEKLGAAGMPAEAGQGPFSATGNDNDLLGQIATNTHQTAANTGKAFQDALRRYVIGGGPLAGIGVTPVELARGRASARDRNLKITVQAGDRALATAIESIVNGVVLAMQRQGVIDIR